MQASPEKAVQDILYEKLGELEYKNLLGENLGSVAYATSKLLSDVAMPVSMLVSNVK